MEEKTARQLIKDVGEISDFLRGNPAFKERGFIDRFDDLVGEVKAIKGKVEIIEKNGVKLRWFWVGASATGGAGFYAGLKALFIKLGWITAVK